MNHAEFYEAMGHLPVVGRIVDRGKIVLNDSKPKELAEMVTRRTAYEDTYIDGTCRHTAPMSLDRTNESRFTAYPVGIVFGAYYVMLAYTRPEDEPNTLHTVQVADITEYSKREDVERAA